LGWKERHVGGFSEAVRDTLRTVVWPNHGEAQGDMATNYPHGVGEKISFDIDVVKKRSGMAKGGECEKEGAQVSNKEGHIKDNNKDTSHLHKKMVGGKEANGREIEDCCEEGEHNEDEEDFSTNKRARTQEEDSGSSRTSTKSKGTTGRVLPKWFHKG